MCVFVCVCVCVWCSAAARQQVEPRIHASPCWRQKLRCEDGDDERARRRHLFGHAPAACCRVAVAAAVRCSCSKDVVCNMRSGPCCSRQIHGHVRLGGRIHAAAPLVVITKGRKTPRPAGTARAAPPARRCRVVLQFTWLRVPRSASSSGATERSAAAVWPANPMAVTRRVHPDIIWGHLSQASQRVRGGLAGEQDTGKDMDFSSVASPHHPTFLFVGLTAALVPHRLACAWGLVNGVLSLSLALSAQWGLLPWGRLRRGVGW